MFKKLPVYKAKVNKDDDTGMLCVSLVDYPAVESDFLAFKEEKETLKFAVQDEDQHIVRGVVMRADFPIYRITESGFEYYITYDKETIKTMAQKYLAQGFQNNVDTMHNFQMESGVELVQWFIKDTENGINPAGFEDIENGSLFAEYKVENEDIWNSIKEGTFKGFSLAGTFETQLVVDPEEQELREIEELIEKIKKKINK